MKKKINIFILFLVLLSSCSIISKDISNDTFSTGAIKNIGGEHNIKKETNDISSKLNDISNKLNDISNKLNDKKYKEALTDLEILNIKNKDNKFILSMLGNTEMKLGELDKALKYFLQANKLNNGKDGNILFNISVVYFHKGDLVKSKEYLIKSEKILPGDNRIIEAKKRLGIEY